MKRKRRLRHWTELPRRERLRLAVKTIGHSREMHSAILLSCGVYPRDALTDDGFRALIRIMSRVNIPGRKLPSGTPASRLLQTRLEYVGDPDAVFIPNLDPMDVDREKHIYSREAMKWGRRFNCGKHILAVSEMVTNNEAISLYRVSYAQHGCAKIAYVAQWQDITTGYHPAILRRNVSAALREANEYYALSIARRLGAAA